MTEFVIFGFALAATASASVVQRGVFTLNSDAFRDGQSIPTKYASYGIKGGMNISLPLKWIGAPAGTKSFALSIIDPHPVANNWIHWMVVNIPPNVTSLPEGTSGKNMPPGSKELYNTYGKPGYGGPQPPKGSGPHPYEVTVYALNVDAINVKDRMSPSEFLSALEGKVIGTANTTGMYEEK